MSISRLHSMAIAARASNSFIFTAPPSPWGSTLPNFLIFYPKLFTTSTKMVSFTLFNNPTRLVSFSLFSSSSSSTTTTSSPQNPTESTDHQQSTSSSNKANLKPGLYLVGTPIGNLEDITLRALRVLKSAHVILSEDTRHSRKLLQHYNITTPLLSYHKFNESQREQAVLKRLQDGEIVALISDAGTPGISDPGMDLAKSCVEKNILVTPIPGPSALVAAVSASGLSTDEFTFVGFLPRHAGTRKERLSISANEATTQIFFVPPHKFCQFLEDTSSVFGNSRRCVIAREITKIHEEFWRGTLGEAKVAFSSHAPKGEITFLIEGKAICSPEAPSESQLETELRELISSGQSLSTAVKLVAAGKSTSRKTVYALALRKFGKQSEAEEDKP